MALRRCLQSTIPRLVTTDTASSVGWTLFDPRSLWSKGQEGTGHRIRC